MAAIDWRIGFHQALVDAIVANGSPHDPTQNSYWGSSLPDDWTEVRPRIAAIGIDYANTPKPIEAEWSEFSGTFHEGDNRKYGVDLELFLLDGTRVWYRYSGTISDLILAVVEDKPCAGTGQPWTSDSDTRGYLICPVCRTTRRAIARTIGRITTTHQVPAHPVKEM